MIKVFIMFINGKEIEFVCDSIEAKRSNETGKLVELNITGLNQSIINKSPLFILPSEVLCIRTQQLSIPKRSEVTDIADPDTIGREHETC